MKDAAKPGEEQAVLLTIEHKDWGSFTAMEHCRIPVSDTAKVGKVLKLIGETG